MTNIHIQGTNMRAVVLLLSFCAAALGASAGPDAAGYTATDQTTYSFQNIASTGARILAGADDATAIVNIGFAFRFYGQDYTSLCISTNGLVSFGACNMDFANADLTSTAPSGDTRIAAPFWTDLNFSTPGSDAVYYQVLGAAPARQFVVQWNAAFPMNGTSGVTFQGILYEGSNKLVFQYLSVGAGGNGNIATVGIRDAGGQTNNRQLQWCYNAAVLKDGMALLFSPAAGPVIQYTITAAVNPAGGGTVNGTGAYPAGSTATLTAVPSTGFAFNSWSGGLGVSTANPLTVRMDGNKSVVANFARLSPVIAASVPSKTGNPDARVWSVQLKNTGAGAASDTQLTGITFTQVAGAACKPVVVTTMPVDYGALAPLTGAASRPVVINFTGCVSTARFTVRFDFRANGGTYAGSSSLGNQFR